MYPVSGRESQSWEASKEVDLPASQLKLPEKSEPRRTSGEISPPKWFLGRTAGHVGVAVLKSVPALALALVFAPFSAVGAALMFRKAEGAKDERFGLMFALLGIACMAPLMPLTKCIETMRGDVSHYISGYEKLNKVLSREHKGSTYHNAFKIALKDFRKSDLDRLEKSLTARKWTENATPTQKDNAQKLLKYIQNERSNRQ